MACYDPDRRRRFGAQWLNAMRQALPPDELIARVSARFVARYYANGDLLLLLPELVRLAGYVPRNEHMPSLLIKMCDALPKPQLGRCYICGEHTPFNCGWCGRSFCEHHGRRSRDLSTPHFCLRCAGEIKCDVCGHDYNDDETYIFVCPKCGWRVIIKIRPPFMVKKLKAI